MPVSGSRMGQGWGNKDTTKKPKKGTKTVSTGKGKKK